MEILENKTNPGAPPVEGDWCVVRIGKNILEREYHEERPLNSEELKEVGRAWRDGELKESDWIVPLTDHPQHAAYMAYRQALRDWPSTADFPDTRPELGA